MIHGDPLKVKIEMTHKAKGKQCSVDGCDTKVRAKGYCIKHYERYKNHNDTNVNLSTTHGLSKHPLYNVWKCMISRCENETDKDYKNYGGRGITVCNEWRDINAFIKDMGKRPTAMHTLDRINNNKGYSPDNCRWADIVAQNRNRRCNILNMELAKKIRKIPLKGRRKTEKGKTVQEIAEMFGVHVMTIYRVINNKIWVAEC